MGLTYPYEVHLTIAVVSQKAWRTEISCLRSHMSVSPVPVPKVLNTAQVRAVSFGLGNSLFVLPWVSGSPSGR